MSHLIRLKKLHKDAKLPKQGTRLSAGFDLTSVEAVTIPALSTVNIPIGLAFEMQPLYYLRVASRGGVPIKHNLHITAGVVDADYTGEVFVSVYNGNAEKEVKVPAGTRIAQAIFEQCLYNVVFDVKEELAKTERGDGSLGSTGGDTLDGTDYKGCLDSIDGKSETEEVDEPNTDSTVDESEESLPSEE